MRMGGDGLPAGPREPRAWQTLGWWYRPLPYLERCRQRYGSTFTLRLIGVEPIVVLAGAEDVRELLTADPELLLPGAGSEVIKPITGPRSIALMDGAEHLTERKLMLPALQGERLRAMTATMDAVTAEAIAAWPAEQPVALHPRVQRLSLDIVMRAILGLELDDERTAPLRSSIDATLMWSARLSNLVTLTRRSVAGRGPWARLLAERDLLDERLMALISQRRTAAADCGDVLAALVSARYEDGAAMSDRQIRDELMTLVAGGHESIALAISWACLALARAPDVLRSLVAEIDGGGDRYLTATVQEALRHRPVLPVLPRKVACDTTLGGRQYPAGVLLQADAYLLHHDPSVYPDPYAFRPERFVERQPGTYTWIPFGAGRRRCIGSAFAMLEMKTILHALLSTRELRLLDRGEGARRHNIGLSPARDAVVRLPRR